MWDFLQAFKRHGCLGCLGEGGEPSDHGELYNRQPRHPVSNEKLQRASVRVRRQRSPSLKSSSAGESPTGSTSDRDSITPIPLPVLPTISELLYHRPSPQAGPSATPETPTLAPPPPAPASHMTPVTRSQTASLPLPVRLLAVPPHPQPYSPLFSLLPAEVRADIFSLALADYPDPSPDRHYEANSCYTRPSYFAPRRTDWALLATCRLVYSEAWHLPFILREQTHWLTAQDRAPPEYRTGHIYNGGQTQRGLLEGRLATISRGLGNDQDFEIEGLRVFAQMYKLEDGSLKTLLGTPGLRPRRVTLTLRHADWWFWEQDERLRVEGQKWVEGVCEVLPASVREFCVELESLERKRDQVDEIAKQMRERWFFKRVDGEGLFADVTGGSDEVTRWTGTSSWNRQRWVRDETAEGRLDYYVVALWFRPLHVVERRGGRVSDEARRACERGLFRKDRLRLTLPPEMKRTPPGPGSVPDPPLQRSPGYRGLGFMPPQYQGQLLIHGYHAVDHDPDL